METTTKNEGSEKATTLLKWRRGRAKVWEYSPTHSKLTLRIELRHIAGNLHIVCGGCYYVCGPFNWDNCELDIECAHHMEKGQINILRDKGARFELHCMVVSVEENVEPIYSANLGDAGA